MAETRIEWADFTWNPWYGCTKISPACDKCYAESWGNRSGMMPKWGAPRVRTSRDNWRSPLRWNNKATGNARPRVFCLSLGDFFDNQVPVVWRHDAWDVIRSCRNLDWLILTKRPQNAPDMLPDDWECGWSHVWMGTTVENMREARRRIPVLARIPAAIHFLSCEPLLEDLDLRPWLNEIDWVIAGGETGNPERRTKGEAEWFANLLGQCRAAKRSFFMKQMTNKSPIPPAPDGARLSSDVD